MNYWQGILEYVGLVKSVRATSIGKALPHSSPANREEALQNLSYIKSELVRARASITVTSSRSFGSENAQTTFQIILADWSIPFVKMAIQVLNDANFEELSRLAADIVAAINPYCERHQDYSDRKVNREFEEASRQARSSGIALGQAIVQINPHVTSDEDDDNARKLLQMLVELRL